MMVRFYKLKGWFNTSLIRVHLCTVAVAVNFNSTWRVPRDAFTYGGLSYGFAFSVALAVVALPISLLQLAVGQLSQQDIIGIWKAVPFFRGIGYLRMLITYIGLICTVFYVTMTTKCFLYSVTNPDTFLTFKDLLIRPTVEQEVLDEANATDNFTSINALNETDQNIDIAEHYTALALISVGIWILVPFLFLSPLKFLRRALFALFPLVLIPAIASVSTIGDSNDLALFSNATDWQGFLTPHIWHAALTQALWSSQVAGGYLVSTADAFYYNTNVQWTSIILFGVNIAFTWAGLIFWYSISGSGEKDTSPLAVLIQIYSAAEEKSLNIAWPLVVFITLILSGAITMITMLYPLHDRFRRLGGHRRTILSVVGSVAGAALSLSTLIGGSDIIELLEYTALPLLVNLITVLEVSAFVFIYGRKVLKEDVEFLTGLELKLFWTLGWFVAPMVLAGFTLWWLVITITDNPNWTGRPWVASTTVATTGVVTVVFLVYAVLAITKQDQYDFIAKLKSTFKPSRLWGPRDPITHYYWLSQREELHRGTIPRTRYNRRQLGQLSGWSRPSKNSTTSKASVNTATDVKKRSNSDDLIYTICRRKHLQESYLLYLAGARKYRSKSLDCVIDVSAIEKR